MHNFDNIKHHIFMQDSFFFNSPELSIFVEPSIQFINYKTIIKPTLSNEQIQFGDPKITNKVSYNLNNYGQRCTDYDILNNNEFNILFAGCSITFGEFLPESYAWPHHVYNYYKNIKNNLGPYRSVSFPGASAPKIISNIFKYIDLYGNPDIIFLVLPDMFRYHYPLEDGTRFHPHITYTPGLQIEKEAYPFRGMYEFVQSYRFLSTICKTNNIKLFATSWDNLANFKMNLLEYPTYDILDYSKLEEFIDGVDMKSLEHYDKDFYIAASDKIHPGLLNQMFIADHFIQRIKNDQ